jgi:hypothetical protein
LVVLGGFGEFTENEVELRTVIVDVRVILVVGDGKLKVVLSSILVTCLSVSWRLWRRK